jgi:tetratricopeptide (TPR) repeat protein
LAIFLGLAGFYTYKTAAYLAEWNDPRSVWYGAHLKTQNPQVAQFLGEIYHNAGDRLNEFVKSAAALQITNESNLAEAVVADPARLQSLRAEWQASSLPRTNSAAYRDQLWDLAWQQYQAALARRGTLSTPNLFMNRGRLLVSQGKSDRAIPEFEAALALAQVSSYEVIRQETVIHALRAIGTAHWHLRNYKAAQPWFVKAVDVQRKSGRVWVSTLDQELQRVQVLAASQP